MVRIKHAAARSDSDRQMRVLAIKLFGWIDLAAMIVGAIAFGMHVPDVFIGIPIAAVVVVQGALVTVLCTAWANEIRKGMRGTSSMPPIEKQTATGDNATENDRPEKQQR